MDVELRRLCRVCAEQCENMINLFIVKRSGLILAEMLSSCIQIQIEPSNTMPSKICVNCINLLCSAYEFNCLAKANQLKFQEIFNSSQHKKEIVEIDGFDKQDIDMKEHSNNDDIPIATEIPIEVEQNSPRSDKLTHREEPAQLTEPGELTDPLESVIPNELAESSNANESSQLLVTKQPKKKNVKPGKKKKTSKLKNPSRTFECYFCKSQMRLQRECRAHIRLHIKATPNACHVCGMFFSLQGLNKHVCHGQSIQCEYCPDNYPSTIKLLEHLKCHKDRLSLYRCAVCSKVFGMSALLEMHKRKHTELERPWICDICNGRFTLRKWLTAHRHIHTDEKSKPTDLSLEKI